MRLDSYGIPKGWCRTKLNSLQRKKKCSKLRVNIYFINRMVLNLFTRICFKNSQRINTHTRAEADGRLSTPVSRLENHCTSTCTILESGSSLT